MYKDVCIPSKEHNYLIEQIDIIKKAISEVDSTLLYQTKEKQKLDLFNPVLDEEELAKCLYGLYIDCTKGMRMPSQNKHDKVRFSAFLYYLVKNTCIKSDRFNQTSFYQFIQKKVFRDLKQNVRTFNNRVTELNILDKAVKRPMDYAKNQVFLDFQHLEKKFRETDFFEGLKRLRSGLSKLL